VSLAGRTILLIRDAEASAGFIAEAQVRGAVVVPFATIAVTDPDSWEECDRAIDGLDGFEFLAFTSANGVAGFLSRCRARKVAAARLRRLTIGVVGPATREAVERFGLVPAVEPRHASARDLAAALRAAGVEGKMVLLPRGDRARPDLPDAMTAAGASPAPVIVYRTVPASSGLVEQVWERVRRGEVDIAAFASPSAAEELAALLGPERSGEFPRRIRAAAIGPTTASTLEALGWKAAVVARRSTLPGLLDAIDELYGTA
jgi:uroporphyrinogen III methyltransferase/synthase